MLKRIHTTTLLQMLCETLLSSEVILKSMKEADYTFQRISECEWVKFHIDSWVTSPVNFPSDRASQISMLGFCTKLSPCLYKHIMKIIYQVKCNLVLELFETKSSMRYVSGSQPGFNPLTLRAAKTGLTILEIFF